ncbi:lipocalin family protein [Luteimonas aestuarii]|nr:lipocalin family protein [Luteimonas aestuarii]
MFNDSLETAAHVDLGRYLGRWFEIARLPNPHQSDECTDVRIDYTLDEQGALRFSRSCINPDGLSRIDGGRLTTKDVGRAKLSVSFVPDSLRWLPFTHRDYWILRIDEDYTMALIGARNRRRLWLLSRARQPDPGLRDEFLAHAERQGFDLTALLYTQQERTHALREWPQPDAHAENAAAARGGLAMQVEAVRVERDQRASERPQ